ncbi:hypothetical protein FORC89_1524 [Salmonella sp. FORC89]|uniref:Uncharacterized protein n=1 Tax=Salmonella enterica subsp. enterica serovar Dublin str. SD3246 TaxID=909945 RepID=A0A8X6EUB4_SALDU|nr:hypothetical protein SD3246_2504 [Salmonella enterica subsp. enterica serovar Dublin str. SD3246]UWN36968.1 hypothetical protein FORC89_1524 [Salmonella sp. FORC89]
MLDTLPGKVQLSPALLCIQVIQYFHRLLATGARRVIIEKVSPRPD